MKRNELRMALALALVVLAGGTMPARGMQATAPRPTSIESLAWMTGGWGMAGTLEIEEYWSRPKGRSLIGMGRTMKGGRTVETESTRIEETSAGIDYVARAGSAQETRFKLIRGSEREAVFENLAHDFPKRIIYRLQPEGGLVARIEGDGSEKEKAMDFPYHRLEWPGR